MPLLINDDLKNQCREGGVGLQMPVFLRTGLRMDAANRSHVQGRGQISADGVKQQFHAFVLVGAAAKYRNYLPAQGLPAQNSPDLFFGDGIRTFKILAHQLFVIFGEGLQQVQPALLNGFPQGFRHRRLQHSLPIPYVCTLAYQIDHASKFVLLPYRNLHRQRPGGQTQSHLLHYRVIIGAGQVHLVDKGYARHTVTVSLPPNRFRLRFHAVDRRKQQHQAIQYAHGTLDLNREIDMPRRVDDIDDMQMTRPTPFGLRRRRSNSDTALAFLPKVVHNGIARMYFSNAVRLARIKENPFGERRLSCVNMGCETDVAQPAWISFFHDAPVFQALMAH